MNYSQMYTPEEDRSAKWSKYDLLQTRFFIPKWIKLRPFGYAMNIVISINDSVNSRSRMKHCSLDNIASNVCCSKVVIHPKILQ